jgi:ABC-type glutathione transport system ATPase component
VPAAPLLLRLVPANNKKSSEPVLRVEHLQAGALPPLTFEVAASECLAIEGPSGAGKTLLLRAIADLDPAPGQVFLNGGPQRDAGLRVASPRALLRSRARVVDGHAARGVRERAAGPVDRLLHSLGLEPPVLDRAVSALSTGERQRLALARGSATSRGCYCWTSPPARSIPNRPPSSRN